MSLFSIIPCKFAYILWRYIGLSPQCITWKLREVAYVSIDTKQEGNGWLPRGKCNMIAQCNQDNLTCKLRLVSSIIQSWKLSNFSNSEWVNTDSLITVFVNQHGDKMYLGQNIIISIHLAVVARLEKNYVGDIIDLFWSSTINCAEKRTISVFLTVGMKTCESWPVRQFSILTSSTLASECHLQNKHLFHFTRRLILEKSVQQILLSSIIKLAGGSSFCKL